MAADCWSCPGSADSLQVRHPGVTTLMQRDFVLMRRAAILCSRLPVLKELRLEESVRQFGGPLKVSLCHTVINPDAASYELEMLPHMSSPVQCLL